MYPNDELYEIDELDELELEDEEIEEVELEEDEVILGVVDNCGKLNVRFRPNPHSDVECVLDADAEVMIDEDESTNEYYKVITASGVEGYCLKKYITVLP